MFKFLKNKQMMQSFLVYLLAFTVGFTILYWGDRLLFDDSEQFEQLDNKLTVLNELVDSTLKYQSELEDSLDESKKLYERRLEVDRELFILIEQRIATWQDILNNTDPNTTDLTIVQAEMADIMQLLKIQAEIVDIHAAAQENK